MKLKFKNEGFALLFSVLIASLLLTIGLSIFNIALKELALSTASRQSIHSFFAADSGRECAKYWDTKRGKIPTLFSASSNTGGDVKCGNFNGDLTVPLPGGSLANGPLETNIPIDPDSRVNFKDDISANSSVEVIKTKNTSDNEFCPGVVGVICTTITSYGYDSTDDDRVERAIEETY